VTQTATVTQSPTVTRTVTVTPTATRTATPTKTPIPNGGACMDPATCQSGNCVDGVCCDRPCQGEFEQCNLPGHVGTCESTVAVPATSRRGLIVGLLLLTGIAALTIARRRRRS